MIDIDVFKLLNLRGELSCRESNADRSGGCCQVLKFQTCQHSGAYPVSDSVGMVGGLEKT